MSKNQKKSKKNGFSRLDFLKTSGLAVGAGLVGTGAKGIDRETLRRAGEARNVIFMVSDGMSAGTLTMAEQIKQIRDGAPTHWMDLYENPDRDYHRGLMDMTTRDSIVPDSASAASAWSVGHLVNNGTVSMSPDGEKHKTILEIFRDAGKATGLVTTTRITHATPAAFSANEMSRGNEDSIAEQQAERGYDVLMGGGHRHYDAELREDGQNLYQQLRSDGFTIARTKDEMLENRNRDKLAGFFYDSHLPFTVDHNTLPELERDVPTLAEMSQTALDILDRHEDGFIMQIEGGRVDHGAHANDAAGLIFDQLAFDEAIKVVLDFTAGRDDTLVVITTDHGNANPGLNPHGAGYRDSPDMFETLLDYRHSFEWIHGEMNEQDTLSLRRIREIVEHATSTGISLEEAEMIQKAYRGEFRAPYRSRESAGAVLAGVLANYNGVYFLSMGHTSDYVEIASWGPGSESIPGLVRSTAMFDLMVDMADVRSYT